MVVGMSEIKRRRLEALDVDCHPGSKVGEYVPFYFCPRNDRKKGFDRKQIGLAREVLAAQGWLG
jgi:hypothetical protein